MKTLLAAFRSRVFDLSTTPSHKSRFAAASPSQRAAPRQPPVSFLVIHGFQSTDPPSSPAGTLAVFARSPPHVLTLPSQSAHRQPAPAQRPSAPTNRPAGKHTQTPGTSSTMSFNGADSADGASMNPSSNLGGSSGSHEITPGDIAVIVGAVVVFALVVFAVFYYRQLQVRRKRAEDLMEMGAVGEEDGVDKKPPIWKFISWKEPKEIGAGAGTAPDVRHDTRPANETGPYHAI
ncbi:hypothetical protein BR93DRAFT_967862 [Coniochaeta sp. PMI_546]|nr:hypothetical protein BR93DRAFT_967862 [Coniochaeta sp. PMI_546]